MVGGSHEPVLERFSAHTVKDSFAFCDLLWQQENLCESAFMCSFDVRSLFTNIPLDETFKICLDTLYRSEDMKPMPIEESLFEQL